MWLFFLIFFFSSRRRHTRCLSDWSSDVCSSDLEACNMQPGIADPANSLVPFGRFDRLHVARFVILDDQGMDDLATVGLRSEERRVGKECRSRWSPYH